MRYVAAYLLAQLGGNTDPSSCDIKAILARLENVLVNINYGL